MKPTLNNHLNVAPDTREYNGLNTEEELKKYARACAEFHWNLEKQQLTALDQDFKEVFVRAFQEDFLKGFEEGKEKGRIKTIQKFINS